MNKTQELLAEGQSIWYDNIQRKLLENGELAGMIERGEIRGVTSNPSIFMNAVTKSSDYDASLAPLAEKGLGTEDIFFHLAVEDIQAAADLFAPLYQQSNGADGYVSLEVSPRLAHDTAGTLAEAKRLWQWVNRPNLMVKIPATVAGLPAITEAIAEGINVNVTLIFSRERYGEVMEAHAAGLEKRMARGLPIDKIESVASFFISRMDSAIDPRLQSMGSAEASALMGKAAIANACLAYADFKEMINSERFQKILAGGGKLQRPLWASTSTKNPSYRDVIYVEELIGPNTVNTVPPQTLTAFLDHGVVRRSLDEDVAGAGQTMDNLEALGISLKQVTAQLEAEGVKAFIDAFDVLLDAIRSRLAG